MQFKKNGPDIPEHLLRAHQDGQVIFFCGAGISYPAGLPGFKGLVDQIYRGLREEPDIIEQSEIEASRFDTAISLLEKRIVGGRTTVRKELAKILTADLSRDNAKATHQALLALAKQHNGFTRLVTTNFDRLFEEVRKSNSDIEIFRAPLLPVPKNRLNGLIYLHGLLTEIPTPNDLDQLVLSSGDFGLAYLTEGWAARFVSELFRNYTVCFVGYSINDPIVRYMMDALAADRLRGESPQEMFAFGSYKKGKEEASANQWYARNVTPILYRAEENDHSFLYDTLREWAETYRDGVIGKDRIVIQYAANNPTNSTKQDDFNGRMLWALSDKCGLPAKRFANHDPIPPLDWLKPLSTLLLKYNVSGDSSLICNSTEDVVVHWLSVWLCKHLNNPKLVLWIAKYGNEVHPRVLSLIKATLKENPPSSPLQTLWNILLSRKHIISGSNFCDWCAEFRLFGLTYSLRLQLRKMLSPRIQFREPFPKLTDTEDEQNQTPEQIRDLIDWEIVLNAKYVQYAFKDLWEDVSFCEALPELLSDATQLLYDTLNLIRELGDANEKHDSSYLYQPSISTHSQNKNIYEWTVLINLVLKAWLETAKVSPRLARHQAISWRYIPYPLFHRLSFFAATQLDIIPPAQGIKWLLAENGWWLWSTETKREALRLLVTLSQKLASDDYIKLEDIILKGPPRSMFGDKADSAQIQKIAQQEIWLRLAKLQTANAPLSKKAVSKLTELAEIYPSWKLDPDERDEFSIWVYDVNELHQSLIIPSKRRELVEWIRQHPKIEYFQNNDDWRQHCQDNFPATACALINLAQKNEWPTLQWDGALRAWSIDPFLKISWRHLGRILNSAPKRVLKKLSAPLSYWLQSIAKIFEGHQPIFFSLIQNVLKQQYNDDNSIDNPVFQAINHSIGRATEAALYWWYRHPLEDKQGLPREIKPLFTKICDTKIAIFRHGRVLLSSNLINLFRVDPKWTKKHLLPLFDWKNSITEAKVAWRGFLHSPRLYSPLFTAFKKPFLDTAEYYLELGEYYNEQYAKLLTFAALENVDIFTEIELMSATRTLPPPGLVHAIHALSQLLENAGAEYWHNRVLPYWKTIWPKTNEIITPEICNALAELCIKARSEFPSALSAIKPWLQPIKDHLYIINFMNDEKIPERFPNETLEFLSLIISNQPQWICIEFKSFLEKISIANPILVSDSRYKRLIECT